MTTDVLRISVIAVSGIASALLGLGLFAVRPAPAPDRGRRGAERAAALAEGGSFRAIEPILRGIAGHLADFDLGRLRRWQATRLERAGQYRGLAPDEYSALILLSAAGFALLGATAAVAAALEAAPGAALGAVFGGFLPLSQVEAAYKRRARSITRGLPPAIYIAAMCMGAGLDFPGALRLITRGPDAEKDDVAKEFALILEELELGHTRKQALLAFAERTPIPAVVDFVLAVCQSEEKGSPLTQTLLVQAKMLNLKRTVAAEEAAARAAVLMIGPLMLLMGCILIILMGPFIVTGGGM